MNDLRRFSDVRHFRTSCEDSDECLDQALFFAGIADRSTGGIELGGQRCIGHAAPDPNHEVVLAGNALPVANQVFEKVEYLWRDGDDVRSAM